MVSHIRGGDSVSETLFLLPKDDYLERWNGRRLSPEEARDRSALENSCAVLNFIIVKTAE